MKTSWFNIALLNVCISCSLAQASQPLSLLFNRLQQLSIPIEDLTNKKNINFSPFTVEYNNTQTPSTEENQGEIVKWISSLSVKQQLVLATVVSISTYCAYKKTEKYLPSIKYHTKKIYLDGCSQVSRVKSEVLHQTKMLLNWWDNYWFAKKLDTIGNGLEEVLVQAQEFNEQTVDMHNFVEAINVTTDQVGEQLNNLNEGIKQLSEIVTEMQEHPEKQKELFQSYLDLMQQAADNEEEVQSLMQEVADAIEAERVKGQRILSATTNEFGIELGEIQEQWTNVGRQFQEYDLTDHILDMRKSREKAEQDWNKQLTELEESFDNFKKRVSNPEGSEKKVLCIDQ